MLETLGLIFGYIAIGAGIYCVVMIGYLVWTWNSRKEYPSEED